MRYDGGVATYILEGKDEKEGVIDIGKRDATTITLRSLRVLPEFIRSDFMDSFERNRQILPDNFISFAYDAGGNDYIFDYSTSIEPRICYLHHEESISIDDVDEDDLEELSLEELQKEPLIYLANSFDEFIERIYPREN